MASDVEIINNALSMLGEKNITSLTDNTVRARQAATLYGPTRDSVLRAHPWKCAIVRKQLAQLSTNPVYSWGHAFQLPADPYCLRVVSMNENQAWGESGEQWDVEGRTLVTNAGTANIKYVSRITDPNQYDSNLYECFALLLASKLAPLITGKDTTGVGLYKIYAQALQQARTVNGQEGTARRVDSGILSDFR